MVYNGKPYFLMDDLGVNPYFWKHPFLTSYIHSDFHQFHFHPTNHFIFKDSTYEMDNVRPLHCG